MLLVIRLALIFLLLVLLVLGKKKRSRQCAFSAGRFSCIYFWVIEWLDIDGNLAFRMNTALYICFPFTVPES